MTKLNTYLNVDGATEDAFNFNKAMFGGELAIVSALNGPISRRGVRRGRVRWSRGQRPAEFCATPRRLAAHF